MTTKKVTTNGGKDCLFKVSEYRGKIYVYRVDSIGVFSDSLVEIGHTGSLEDALILIKSYSGYGIKSITDW